MNAKKAAAMIGIRADSKALDRDVNDARKKMRAFGNDVKKLGKSAGSKLWGGGKSAISAIGGGIGAAAVFGISEQISATQKFEMGLVRLQIAAGKSTAEIDAVRESIFEVSKATGVSTEDILEGTQAYIDLTGDVDGATAAMSQFARISAASGASVADVATATAALKESMGLDPGDIETVFSGLIQQGKAGAVSLKDFAGELSKLAPQFAKFGGSGVQGIADLGASFQVVRKGFGSASEAATGMQAVISALSRNAKKFEKSNVKIFKTGKNGKKEFRGWLDIIDQIDHSKLANDPTALTDAFGSVEASRAFDMLRANRGELEKIYEAGLDAGAVQRDLGTLQESNAGRMQKAMNDLKVTIAETFTPERITAFVEIVEKVAAAIGKVIGGLEDLKNDLSGETEAKANPYAVSESDVGEDNWRWIAGPATANSIKERVQRRQQEEASRRQYYATLYGPDSEYGQREQNRTSFKKTRDEIAAAGGREAQIRKAVEIEMESYGDDVAGSRGRHDAAALFNDDLDHSKKQQIREDITASRTAQNTVDLVGAFTRALREAKITVKLDSGAVQQKLDNSPAQRSGRR